MKLKALSFIYNNTTSEDYGLYIGSLNAKTTSSSMASSNSEIVYDFVNNRLENFIYGVKLTERLLEFEIELFFENYENLDKNDIKYIDSWLFSQKYPQRLVFCTEDLSTYYYKAIFKKNDILYHNNKIYGFKCSIQCDSAYAYTSEKQLVIPITSDKSIARINNISSGVTYIYPSIRFVCNKEGGSIVMTNKSDNNRSFIINNLKQGEEIYIDKWFQITSSYGLKRLGNCNKRWIRLKDGVNYIEVSGNTSRVVLTYQFMQGIGS